MLGVSSQAYLIFVVNVKRLNVQKYKIFKNVMFRNMMFHLWCYQNTMASTYHHSLCYMHLQQNMPWQQNMHLQQNMPCSIIGMHSPQAPRASGIWSKIAYMFCCFFYVLFAFHGWFLYFDTLLFCLNITLVLSQPNFALELAGSFPP